MNRFKLAAVGSILIASSLYFAACSDEGENENDKPDIFEQVEMYYSDLNGITKCSEISSYSTAKASLENNPKMSKACEKYKSSLTGTAGNNVDKLIKNLDNSGYYLAAFLLLNRLTDQISECTPDTVNTRDKAMKDWEAIFEKHGCGDILTKAEAVAKKRGE